MMTACTGLNAQIMFKTEYFGESDYRMTEGDTDRKVGNSKGSAVVYQEQCQYSAVDETR